MGVGRARVGVPPGERRLRAAHVERVGAAAVGRPERLAGHERGVAWRGCGSGGVERTVVPWDHGRPEGAPERSARAPTAISLGEHCPGRGAGGWGVGRGGV